MDERPITRAEMLELFAAQRADILERLAVQKQEILDGVQEQIRDSQTEILKAFLPYQESSNLRMQLVEATCSNTNASVMGRMAVLERRLQEIEKKLFLNPPAA